jgi:hypothetical protein
VNRQANLAAQQKTLRDATTKINARQRQTDALRASTQAALKADLEKSGPPASKEG